MYSAIAAAAPFSGPPRITLPTLVGASPQRPFLWRLTALGKRPLTFTVTGLPETLTFADGLVTGRPQAGVRKLTVAAENALGRTEKTVTLDVRPDGLLRTPLLGFTTWNAFESEVRQTDVENTARLLIETGLADYGYCYVNTDSGWQGVYGGAHDAVQPNAKFPDMKALCGTIHGLGLKAGIYSTPMLTAWGCPKELASIPGCTRGRPDPRYADTNGGIGLEHKEDNNAAQWADWGFDYLKYDFRPCEPDLVQRMKAALTATPRDFALSLTVDAQLRYADHWRALCNSYRCNPDTDGSWATTLRHLELAEDWFPHTGNGHFYDMDMLDTGENALYACRLTDDEKRFSFTARAFLLSPIQISRPLDTLPDFELSLYANEEVLAVSQDALTRPPVKLPEQNGLRLYSRGLENGDTALAVFNPGDDAAAFSIDLDTRRVCRDLWQKADVGTADTLRESLPGHCALLYRLSRA